MAIDIIARGMASSAGKIKNEDGYFQSDTVEGALQELGAAKLNPVAKTDAMTQDVGADAQTGRLYTTPVGGGGNVPVSETYTIMIASWTALASSAPYDYSATVTATHTIGTDTVCRLKNDNAVLFATHGFAIGSVSGQTVTIYSIGTPSASVSLEVDYVG